MHLGSYSVIKTKTDLIKALIVTSELYQKPFSDAAARLLVEDLSEYPVESVLIALSFCRKELRNFPTVSDIVARIPGSALNPAQEAQLVTGEIMKAITHLGPYKTLEAKQAIGVVGWEVIRMSGGWESVCQLTDRDIGVHRSQWAKLAESLLMRRWTPEKTAARIEHKSPIQIQLKSFPKEPK